jgi:hypothetical protein
MLPGIHIAARHISIGEHRKTDFVVLDIMVKMPAHAHFPHPFLCAVKRMKNQSVKMCDGNYRLQPSATAAEKSRNYKCTKHTHGTPSHMHTGRHPNVGILTLVMKKWRKIIIYYSKKHNVCRMIVRQPNNGENFLTTTLYTYVLYMLQQSEPDTFKYIQIYLYIDRSTRESLICTLYIIIIN